MIDKRTALISLLTLSVFLSACNLKPDRDDEDRQRSPVKSSVAPDGSIRLTSEQAQAIGIKTTAVEEQSIPITIDTIGRVIPKPGSEAQVFAPFSGRLIVGPSGAPRLGSIVEKGQILAQVEQLLNVTEKTQVRANVAQVEANIVQAEQEVTFRKTEMDRTKQLYEVGGMPLKRVQTAEFDLKQAQARLEGAKRAKEVYEAAESLESSGPQRASIVAPISGTVVAVDLTSGQMTDPAKNLLTIIDLTTVWVEAPVNEGDLPSVQKAGTVEIATPASPGRVYSGRVITIGNLVDPSNRTVEVIIAADNHDGSLKIGMTSRTQIPIGTSRKGIVLPASAVLLSEGGPAVYVETGAHSYRQCRVTTGPRFGDKITITSGLNPDDRVVTIGAEALLGEASKGQIPTEED